MFKTTLSIFFKKRATIPEPKGQGCILPNEKAQENDTIKNESHPKLTLKISENLKIIKKLFKDDDTVRIREFQNSNDPILKFVIVFFDGLVNNQLIDDFIVRPLIESEIKFPQEQTKSWSFDIIDEINDKWITINSMIVTESVGEIIENVTYGETILFADNSRKALILNTKGFTLRSLSEPQAEKSIYGPREGFTEGIMINLSLVRRRLRSNHLKMKFKMMGRSSRTTICIAYMDNIAKSYLIDSIEKKLQQIEIDGIFDSNYIAECIRDNKKSPFPTIGSTERPDTVAEKLLEGRIAIFVDGSPMVLTLPFLFIENFQTSEDYCTDPFYSSIARSFRICSFFLTIAIPSIFVTLVAFHPQMIPTPLMLNIASERKILPLPAAVEIFCMLIIFDILRETGVRMPSSVGQALSIVGAIVIGQAAVAAKLVSASTIIAVGVTGITSLLIPKINSATVISRIFLLIISSLMGFYGFICGLMILFIHILNLRSFGLEQSLTDCDPESKSHKNEIIRSPIIKMKTRPSFLTENKTKLKLTGDYLEEYECK